jgi:hypothetical protein
MTRNPGMELEPSKPITKPFSIEPSVESESTVLTTSRNELWAFYLYYVVRRYLFRAMCASNASFLGEQRLVWL